jgi:uncharacterized protein YbaR (Trm112 family)
MFIELVDALRCPNQHEESWMVASADRMEARHIVSGTLGCPVCKAEFPIRDGVVDFRQREGGRRPEFDEARPIGTDVAVKLAALLDLTDAQGFAVLVGEWGAHATMLANLVDTPLIVVDPADEVVGAPGISVIRCDGEIPLATASARGIAIDAPSEQRIGSAIRVVRSGGRVLAPVAIPLPAGVRELARSEELWVAEREALASPLVALHVRRG